MTIQHSYERILVATDFSEPSAAALKQAVWLSRGTGASITLAHVLPTLYNPVTSGADPAMDMLTDLLVNEGESKEEFEAAARKEADAKMGRMIEQHADSIDVQTRIFVGSSFAETVYAVERDRYDLVLAGTRGLAQWEQFIVGSTAKRLIRNCPSSVWIVKAEHVGQPKVVLAATDFSEVSRKAVSQGLLVAQHANAEFHVLHVVDSKDVPEDVISRIPKGSSLQQEINQEASKRMDAFVSSLEVDRASIQVHQSWGTPWQEIRRAAKFLAADLIVIGTVGRSGIQGLLLGNTAEKILDTCDCSILTVKPDGFQSPLKQ
jgi:nucleotide-binding universal stress UspA family protein